MATAVEPTPPDAPVTRTGPSPGRRPCSSSAWTLIAAVNPAVPIAIASRAVRPAGSGTTQPDGIRASSAVPAVARRADVVPVREDAGAHGERVVVGGDDGPGQVDAGDQRVAPGHAAVLAGREAVLEVHAGPLDADGHLARRQVGRRQVRRPREKAPPSGGRRRRRGTRRAGLTCADDARARGRVTARRAPLRPRRVHGRLTATSQEERRIRACAPPRPHPRRRRRARHHRPPRHRPALHGFPGDTAATGFAALGQPQRPRRTSWSST